MHQISIRGKGSLNRPDAKGKLVERLDKRYSSRDEGLNTKNQNLKKVYSDLLLQKSDIQEASTSSGSRKGAQFMLKNYNALFREAEALRKYISHHGATPVPKPDGVTKDPLN